jgi:hypothetical protein
MTRPPDHTERGADPPDPPDRLPTVHLQPPDDTAALLRSLQAIVLKHPAAAQAAFRALVAEGEAFARTPEGQSWKRQLENSTLLHRARLILDFPGIAMLEADSPGVLPSTYIDTIFMLASSRSPDEVLNHLFRWDQGQDERA